MLWLLDTDIVNFILRNRAPVTARYAAAVRNRAEFVLCPVVHYEVTRYFRLKGASQLQRLYDDLVSQWSEVNLASPDWDTAADLWAARHRAGRPIADADLLIAVTVLKTGATLVTNNTSHFDGLGLTVANWMAA